MKIIILTRLFILLAMSSTCFAALSTDKAAGECGPQGTPEDTWKSWHENYVSGEWKRWFECHSKSAQAALFLSSALSTPNSKEKIRVIDKYGKCESRSESSLECVTDETVADFFHEMTVLDEEASRSRLSKIWRMEGMRIDGANLESVVRHDEDNAIAEIQSKHLNGKIESWAMAFLRVDGRWFVTFKWGM